MKIIFPKTFVLPESIRKPLFFLGGPVLGGGDWQSSACWEIQRRLPDFFAANPCRYPESHPLQKFKVSGTDERTFPCQTEWERLYLAEAGESWKSGCIIFWLPCQSVTEPRTDGSPYARDTYGELGEWRGRLMRNPKVRLVIGAQEFFPGLEQIARNFNHTFQMDFPIHRTLEETVEAAIRMVN